MTARSALDEIQDTVATAVEQVGPSVVGLGQGWHPGSGVVVSEGLILTNAHALRRNAADRHFRRRPPGGGLGRRRRPEPRPGLLSADTAGVRPVDWPAEAPTTGDRHRRRRAGQPRRPRAARHARVRLRRRSKLRGRAGAASRAASSTRPSSRAARAAGPSSATDGKLLGLNAIRLEGGLIVAVPTGAAARIASTR